MRLDVLVSEREGISRTRAQNLIKTGGVTVDSNLVNKPSFDVNADVALTIRDTLKYASLGGIKLENALDVFDISVENSRCLDIGAANGGFTDCLLKRGAKEVFAVDLNVAFPPELLSDDRVRIYDKVNVKDLSAIFCDGDFDFLCADLSFISLTGLFSMFFPLLKKGGRMVVLFKPQFEVGKKSLPKSGVVRDGKTIEKTFSAFCESAKQAGFSIGGDCPIPQIFPDKNAERTVLLLKE